jgi:hypothetical protein
MRVRIEFDSRRGRVAFRCGVALAAAGLAVCVPLYASQVGALISFSPGQVIKASDFNSNFTALKVAINDTDNKCGNLTTLTTTAKGDLVSAVNEVNGKITVGALTTVTHDASLTGSGTSGSALGVDLSATTGLDGRYLKLTSATSQSVGPAGLTINSPQGLLVNGPASVLPGGTNGSDALVSTGGPSNTVNAGGVGLIANGGPNTSVGLTPPANGGAAIQAKGGASNATGGGNGGNAIEATGGGASNGHPGLAALFHGPVGLDGDVSSTNGFGVVGDAALEIRGTASTFNGPTAGVHAQGGVGAPGTLSLTPPQYGATGGQLQGGDGGAVVAGTGVGGGGGPGVTVTGGNGGAGPGPSGTGFDGVGGAGATCNGGNAGGFTNGVGGDGVTASGGLGSGTGLGGNGITATAGGTLGALGFAGLFKGDVKIMIGPAGSTGALDVSGPITNPGGTVMVTGGLHVTGALSKGSGTFQIDHPLDPENKFLYHSFVESPDMMNVYNGVVVLDEKGEATVELPSYFEVLNKDFRYQLTCIGAAAVVYVSKEIHENHFSIAGGKPGLKVSWQVTGIRQDAYANAHRVQVEVEKRPAEKGKLLYPVENGRPESDGIYWDSTRQAHAVASPKVAATQPAATRPEVASRPAPTSDSKHD